MRRQLTFLALCAVSVATQSAGASEVRLPTVDHSKWTHLLREYVDEESRVDYQRLRDEALPQLDAYLAEIAQPGTRDADLDTQQSKALLINAYNALTVRWILQHYPVPSIWSTPDPFKQKRHTVAGSRLSLDEIESKLRETGDPRIHAALVCAARSCPPLRREAYTAEQIDEQLDDNTRRWLADPKLNRFDVSKRQAQVSSIFKWYREEFESYPGGLEGFLKRYAPDEISDALGDQPLKITFLDYHWGLNDQSDLGKNYSTLGLGIDWLKNVFR